MSVGLNGPVDNSASASTASRKPFNFSARTTGASIGSKVGNVAGKVAKGTAAVAGIGVLGTMAGTVALGTATKNKKDELCASMGESMSYLLARLLGGNDHMTVQRLQQAGMRGVQTGVQNNKALNRATRPLPTLNMPVAQDCCDMSL